jgi:peptidoglycan-N-acetylglucosamine deacetylase
LQRMLISVATIFSFLFLLQPCVLASNNAIYSVQSQEEGKQNIALTFDDGPHGTLTPMLLNALMGLNAKVTFFVMGVKVVKHEAILKKAVADGHEIANHVWNHPVLTKISFDEVYNQLLTTNEAIRSVLNVVPTIMRPPYGNTNAKLNEYIQNKGNLSVIMWSLDTLDWRRPNPQKIIDLVLTKAKAGDIILCHDIHPGTIQVREEKGRDYLMFGLYFFSRFMFFVILCNCF